MAAADDASNGRAPLYHQSPSERRPEVVLGEKVADEKGEAVGMSIKSVGPDWMTVELTMGSEEKSKNAG